MVSTTTINHANNHFLKNRPSESSYCWIYLSGFNSCISSEQVLNYVRYKLHCTDIECFPLLPKGLNISSRRQLSFKIKTPASVFGTAKRRGLWPSHVTVRPFLDDKDFIKKGHGSRRPHTVSTQPKLQPLILTPQILIQWVRLVITTRKPHHSFLIITGRFQYIKKGSNILN